MDGMLKHIWALLIMTTSLAFSQRAQIDSLTQLQLSLTGTARIDCFNHLSLAYYYQNRDSAHHYAGRALKESRMVNYEKGLQKALLNEAIIAGHEYNFARQEGLSREVIKSSYSSGSKAVYAQGNLNLALALFYQGRYDEALRICSTVRQMSNVSELTTDGEALAISGAIEFERGSYAQSFRLLNESLQVFRSNEDTYNLSIVLAKIGDFYQLSGDRETALSFYYQSLRYKKGPALQWHPLEDLGDTYYTLQVLQAPGDYQNQFIQSIKHLSVHSNPLIDQLAQAEHHRSEGRFANAIAILRDLQRQSEGKSNHNLDMRLLWEMTALQKAKGDLPAAIASANALREISTARKNRQYIRDANQYLYQFNDVLNATTNAYQYFKKFTSLKDSIAFEQFSQRLAIYKAVTQSEKNETQIKLLSHENTINRQNLALREQEIEASSTARNFLIAGIGVIIIAGLILFRNIELKRKNESGKRELAEKQLNLEKIAGEKRASQLLQQAAELEMQALRSQMNPHFIFNSLNSINRFILQNNKSEASEYLTRFSSLMRVILQGSQSDLISVENELNNLKLYLDLESLRFNFHFEYRIIVSTDIEGLKVPPLVIQPFVENSIWHGLMPKEAKGHLVIEVSRDENFLRIRITDDGIGRIKSAELRRQPSSYKSLGMEITSKRMALLNHNSKDQIEYVEIKDLVLADGSPAGTEVNLNIPATYD
jgi:hypothetical protein